MITNETLDVIRQRRSIRRFESRQIDEDRLQAILEAGQYAPNGGDQAWHFTVVQNRDVLSRLNDAAKEAAMHSGSDFMIHLATIPGYDCVYGAPSVIFVSGDERCPIPLDADLSAAMQNMLLAAESLGLGSCWIYFVTMAFDGPQGAELRRAAGIPDGFRPRYAAALGYRDMPTPTAPPRKPGVVNYVR